MASVAGSARSMETASDWYMIRATYNVAVLWMVTCFGWSFLIIYLSSFMLSSYDICTV
jgi:hypothetical protein